MSGLYQGLIQEALDVLRPETMAFAPAGALTPWPTLDREPYLMERETALTLGGPPCKGSYVLLPQERAEMAPPAPSGVYTGGPGLQNLGGGAVAYACVLIPVIPPLAPDTAYDTVKSLEQLRYGVHLQGVMRRASPARDQEQLRLSRAALDNGFSLQAMGAAVLARYLGQAPVQSMQVYYILGDPQAAEALAGLAGRAAALTKALCVLPETTLDCADCGLSVICDEVEALRLLHKGPRKAAR